MTSVVRDPDAAMPVERVVAEIGLDGDFTAFGSFSRFVSRNSSFSRSNTVVTTSSLLIHSPVIVPSFV